MENGEAWIWYDGELVPWAAATTHVMTHSLHYGLSVFEGVRAYRTVAGKTGIFRLHEHTRRLFGSARIYRMSIPFTPEVLARAQLELLRANSLPQAYLRPIAFYGPEKRGLSPRGARVHVAIAAWDLQGYLGAEAAERGIRVKTSSFARHHVNVNLPRAKIAAAYANSILANLEATEDGYDEALLLDTEGFVAEGSGENVFIVKDGSLYEPELTSALLGITRDSIIGLARDRGYSVGQRRLTRDDLYLADEAFFAGTAAEIVPIVELDRRLIGDGKPGPVTRALQEAFTAAVTGRDPRSREWLSLVE